MPLLVEHLPITLRPDPTRVVLRPFMPADTPLAGHDPAEHRAAVLDRLLAIPPRAAERKVARLLTRIGARHEDAGAVFDRRFDEVRSLHPRLAGCAAPYRRLIGACFSEEYAFEAAALFNPSIVLHPSQDDAPPGGIRFVLSIRAVGEGHVSSVIFRTGTITADGTVTIDPPAPYPTDAAAAAIDTAEGCVTRYTLANGGDLSRIVLFPASREHRRGIEDVRIVRFDDGQGQGRYIGTLTGIGAQTIRQEILLTHDFRSFDLAPITGPYATTKGMVPFPRRIGGRYAMLARPDHDALWLLTSDTLRDWTDGTPAITPQADWEAVQIGNCGAPIELADGWLVLTHGVGPLRTYAIGACLLDRDDPTRVVARLRRPLIAPDARRWAGYVPNSVYSCGALVHAGWLYLPYGVADSFVAMARIELRHLLSHMTSIGPH